MVIVSLLEDLILDCLSCGMVLLFDFVFESVLLIALFVEVGVDDFRVLNSLRPNRLPDLRMGKDVNGNVGL